jgi:RNA polymerase sigma-70 factor (ECF subfamily)
VSDDDRDLFDRARAGDAGAVERLIAQYLPQLHAFVRVRLGGSLRVRESSMDVVQSTCRELLAAPGGFKFDGEERFRAWLFTAALNKLRDKQRFHQSQKRDLGRETPIAGDTGLAVAANLLTPSVDAIGKETAVALQASLDALSEEHREVVTMARIAKLPHNVIAEMMGRSEAAVRQLLMRALLRLAQEMSARGVDVGDGPD